MTNENGWQQMAQRLDGFEQRLLRVEAQMPQNVAASEAARVRSDTIFVPQVAANVMSPRTPILPNVPPPYVPNAPAAPKAAVEKKPNRTAGAWENVVGGQWALWAGVASLFLALALFLAYAWQSLPPIPPWARVMMGIGGGAILLVGGAWTRGRGQRWFSEGLSGAGLAMIYLSVWAGAQSFGIISFTIAFAAMALTTALGVFLALRYDAQGLSVLATLGGFCTPILLQSSGSGQSQAWGLLTYVALLNGGILASSVFKRWRKVTWLSLGATALLVGGWYLSNDSAASEGTLWAFLTLYWLMFAGAACFYSLRRKEATAQNDLLLLFASVSLYAPCGYGLLAATTRSFPAAFPLGLSLAFGALTFLVCKIAPHNRTLRDSAAGLSILFLTLCVPLQLKESALAIGWIVEAGVLIVVAHRVHGQLLLRAGQIVWLLSLAPIWLESGDAELWPLWNARTLSLATFVVVNAIIAWQTRRTEETKIAFDELRALYPLAATLGGAWLVAQEIYLWLERAQWPMGATWKIAAWLLIGMFWHIGALLCVRLGKTRQNWQAWASALLGGAAGLTLLTAATESTRFAWLPILNLRFGAFVIAIACALWALQVLAGRKEARNWLAPLGMWALFLGFWAITQETWESAYFWRGALGSDWERTAQMAISLVWALWSAALLVTGIRRDWQPLRLAALGLLGLTVVKLFGFDLSFLQGASRIFSLVGVGAALIFISWLYSRYGNSGDASEGAPSGDGVA